MIICRENRNLAKVWPKYWAFYTTTQVLRYCCQRHMQHNNKQNAFLRLHTNDGYANASQCYVTRTLPILLRVTSTFEFLFGPGLERKMSWSDLLQNQCTFINITFYFWHVMYLAIDKEGTCALRNPLGDINVLYFGLFDRGHHLPYGSCHRRSCHKFYWISES